MERARKRERNWERTFVLCVRAHDRVLLAQGAGGRGRVRVPAAGGGVSVLDVLHAGGLDLAHVVEAVCRCQ